MKLIKRESQPEAAVSLRAMVTLWHSWVLEQSLLVWNLFCTDIFVDVSFWRCWVSGVIFVACLPNTRTFVLTKRSFPVSLLCLAVRRWWSPKRWPCRAVNPVQICCKFIRFLSRLNGRRVSVIRSYRWLWAWCSAVTAADQNDAIDASKWCRDEPSAIGLKRRSFHQCLLPSIEIPQEATCWENACTPYRSSNEPSSCPLRDKFITINTVPYMGSL